MNVQVHPARIELRGDERYNPRFTQEAEFRPSDGATRITGWIRPDGPKCVATEPPLPDLPFRFIVPVNADYTFINFEVWQRLQTYEPLWDLDFSPPPPTQEASNAAGVVLVGALVIGAILLAFKSRN